MSIKRRREIVEQLTLAEDGDAAAQNALAAKSAQGYFVKRRLEGADTTHGLLIVLQGKSRKDGAVSIGAAVCVLLQTYVSGVRVD